MTTAEMFRAEGKAEGEILGRTKSLVQILTKKFGTLPKDVSKKVQEASSSQIEEWTDRAITAEKLDEVFG